MNTFSDQQADLLRESDWMLRALSAIAQFTKKLEVASIVRAAARKRRDVVHVVAAFDRGSAIRAPMPLLLQDSLDVLDGVAPRGLGVAGPSSPSVKLNTLRISGLIFGFARAFAIKVGQPPRCHSDFFPIAMLEVPFRSARLDPIRMGSFPSRICSLGFLWIFLSILNRVSAGLCALCCKFGRGVFRGYGAVSHLDVPSQVVRGGACSWRSGAASFLIWPTSPEQVRKEA